MERPQFDLSLIGEADVRNLCSTFLEAIQRFYDDPANLEKVNRLIEARKAAENG